MKKDINKMLITLLNAKERYQGKHNKDIRTMLTSIILLLHKLENILKCQEYTN